VPQLLVEGIKFGAIIAITAVGLSLVFGTTGLINFAHGEYVTIGAVAAYFLSTGPGNLPLLLAAVLAMAATALVAGGFEVAMWRPMRRRGTGLIQMFIVAIGLSLLLRHVILIVFGSRRQQYDEYSLQQSWDLGPIRITPRDLIITLLAFAIMLAVALMLQRTRIGKAMRAVNDNVDLAQASGIDTERVILVVWLLGGALAGLGGVFFGLTQAVYADMGFALLLLMFAGVILGGLGSAYGAMLGSLVIGVVSQMSTLWFPASLQYMWALLAMILVLLVRPQGILGRRERVG
jgi:branched-chain amino acid transport system permease protein